MARESRRKDEETTGLESAVRSTAGLGVGYAAINNYRTIYNQVKRSFLGLPMSDSMKKSFQRIWQFSGMDFQKHSMDATLSSEKYITEIPQQSIIDQMIDSIQNKNKQIRQKLQTTSNVIQSIQDRSVKAARQIGAGTDSFARTVNNLRSSFDEFSNDYFEKAVSSSEQAMEMSFSGRAGARQTEILRDLRFEQLRALNDQLSVVRNRLDNMTSVVRQTNREISGIWTRGITRRVQQAIEKGAAGQMTAAREVAMQVIDSMETHIQSTNSILSGLTDISINRPQALQHAPIKSKMWSIKGGSVDLRRQNTLRKLIGDDAFRSVNETVQSGFRDPFAPNDPIIMGKKAGEVKEVKTKFFKYIAETIRDLDKTNQFESINIETTQGPTKQVVLRAVPKNPATFGTPDLLLRYDIPETTLGIRHVKRGVKDFFVPFQRQRDILLEQARTTLARMPWDTYNTGKAQDMANRIRHQVLINTTQFSSTTLSDYMTSGRIDTKIHHQLSKVYQGGFEALEQIRTNKVARGAIMHIDTEFGESMIPTQIGWTMTDADGKVITVKQFAIGPKAATLTPAHIQGKSIAGKPIVTNIAEDQFDKVIDALVDDMNHPRTHGHPVQVAGKNFGMAEGVTLGNLLKMAEERGKGINPAKLVQLRSAITKNVIDTNFLSSVSGDVIFLKGAHLFRLIRDHVGNYPELKSVVESKLLQIGIPGLGEDGLRAFEKGLHNAVQDSFMQALYADVVYAKNKFSEKGLPAFEKALARIRDGFLPGEFISRPKAIADMTKAEAIPLLARNVSAASFLGGRESMTDVNLAGPFPHLRRGQDYRPISSQQLRHIGKASVNRRINAQISKAVRMGVRPDMGHIIKGVMNDIQTKTLVSLDPSISIAKDEFLLSARFLRRKFEFPSAEIVEVDKLNEKNVFVGKRVMAGEPLGTADKTGRVVMFKGIEKGETGIIRAIEPGGETGRTRIIVDRMWRLGQQTPVLTGSGAALISATNLEDVVPHVGPKYSSFRLADYATKEFKANPGSMMTDMFTFMFEHAGNDRHRQSILTQIIKKKFKGGQGGVFSDGFPIDRRLGQLSVGHRDVAWWRDFAAGYKDSRGSEMGIGIFVEVADEYNKAVNGAFVTPKIFLDNMSPPDFKAKFDGRNVLPLYARIFSDPTAVEANVKIAMRNLRRETNPNLVTRVVNQARGALDQGDVFKAMQIMRPDIAAEERSVMGFMNKLPAMFGLMSAKLPSGDTRIIPGTVSTEPISVSDLNVFSRVGDVLKGKQAGRIGFGFLGALKNFRGSQNLINYLSEKMYSDSIMQITRMFPHAHATGAQSFPHMKSHSSAEVSKLLDRWLALSDTSHLIKPSEQIYRVNGQLMSEGIAKQHFGVSGIKFREAVEKGLAERVTDMNVIRKSLRAPSDVFQITNMGPFEVNFGRSVGVQVKGMTQFAKHDRMMVWASNADYFPLEVENKKTGAKEVAVLESPSMQKLRGVIQALNSGQAMDVTGKNLSGLIQDYYDLQGSHVLKANIFTHQQSVSVPVTRMKANPVFDLVNTDITTKAQAQMVMEKVFGQKGVSKDMFLGAKGILPDEGLIAGTDEKLVQILQTMTDDDRKSVARRMLGNVKMADRSGISPRSFMMRHLAGEIALQGGPLPGADALRPRMQNVLGTMRQIINSKSQTAGTRKAFQEAFMDGLVPIPMFGAKYPIVDQSKFVMGFFYRSSVRGEEISKWQQKFGTGTGKMAVAPFASTIVGNIDADKDLVQFYLNLGEKVTNIINKNSSLPVLDPIVQIADNVGDDIVTFNVQTGQSQKYPVAQVVESLGLEEFKNKTINKQLLTKQLAGVSTLYSENIRPYLSRMLGGRGSKLANDIGQDTVNKMFMQAWEAGGALTESILKGKAMQSDGAGAIANIFSNFDIPGFQKFRKAILEGPQDPLFRKLTTKIAGTEQLFPGTRGLGMMDLLGQVIQEGNGNIWSGMAPEEKISNMSLRARDIYGMKGALVDAWSHNIIGQNVPTKFNTFAQESVLSAIKNNVQREVGERQWKLASKGMGWMAAAGALYTAFNVFRPDQTKFLGHMPGQGGETFDYTFTRPEYKMQNLLNVPYTNPYAKDKTYVVMDNPATNAKLARMTQRELTDITKIHETIGVDRPRVTSRDTQIRVQRTHRQLLDKFGVV